MRRLFKEILDISDRGKLRKKLTFTFFLMLSIPLLSCAYFASVYLFFPEMLKIKAFGVISLTSTLLVLIPLTLLGLFRVVKGMVDGVLMVSAGAKKIVEGNLNHKIKVETEDEIGELGNIINQLSKRIKENMEELKSYSEKTKEMDTEIHKRILYLSRLLQVGDLISSGTAKLEEITPIIVEGLALAVESDSSFLLLHDEETDELVMDSVYRPISKEAENLRVKFGQGPLGRAAKDIQNIILDAQRNDRSLKDILGLKNVCIVPISAHGRGLGLLGMGNNHSNFVYKEESIELAKIFAKQASIAVENALLLKRAEQLEIEDELIGVYNQRYIKVQLNEEIKKSVLLQRPCSFIIFSIDDFMQFRKKYGQSLALEFLKELASILKDNVREIDKVARWAEEEFAILLPERNKPQAVDIAEDLRKKIEQTPLLKDKIKGNGKLTVSGGVAENPIDGCTSEELIEKATRAVKIAKAEGRNRISA